MTMPDFARNPADALQCYADVQRTVHGWSVDDLQQLGLADQSDDDKALTLKYLKRLYSDYWATAVYFWGASVYEKVLALAESYPLDSDQFSVPPSAPLFFAFQHVPSSICKDQLSAQTFASYGSSACVISWIWSGGHCTVGSHFLGPLNALPTQGPGFAKFLGTAVGFAAQRLIGKTTTQVSRAVRQRVVGHVPDVNVVSLRAYDQSGRERSEGLKEIDFNCRWWVRGHERNQYIPSTGGHEKIWIDPYLKGPDDKPIKERDTVFAMVR